jgi:hypothetical protein
MEVHPDAVICSGGLRERFLMRSWIAWRKRKTPIALLRTNGIADF